VKLTVKTFSLALSLAFLTGAFLTASSAAAAEEFNVYQVYRAIDLGENDISPPKDIFINMGAENGIKKGSILDVYRKVSSFDNLTQKHMGDSMIPVGRIKVIHADDKIAIARADKFVSVEQEPALLPQAVMIGDVVRPVQ
jgi:hypothetical protein